MLAACLALAGCGDEVDHSHEACSGFISIQDQFEHGDITLDAWKEALVSINKGNASQADDRFIQTRIQDLVDATVIDGQIPIPDQVRSIYSYCSKRYPTD